MTAQARSGAMVAPCCLPKVAHGTPPLTIPCQVLGGIGVLEMAQPLDTERVTLLLVERGVWLRPFGKLLYAMPPFVISERELAAVTDAMAAVVDAVEREAM